MKKLSIILLGIILLTAMGCAGLRGGILDLSKEDMLNADTTRQTAKNLLSTWRLNSGFIRGSLGNAIFEFPAEAVKAMDELDALALKATLDDFDLGYSLGLRVRILSELVANALAKYAPQVMKYLPITF